MKNIKILTDEDFGLDVLELKEPRIRFGARGIVFNQDNKIAILNKQLKNEYKLIGGGMEKDEDPKLSFEREVLEESGCNIEIIDELGMIEEIKSHDNFKQISYIFVANVIGEIGETNFTEKEMNEGAQILWLDIEDAIKLIKDSEDKLVASKYENVYHSKFIVRRDYEILKYYKENFMKQNIKVKE